MVRKFVEKYPADQSIELTENEDDDFIKSPISKEQKDIISRLKRKLKSSNKTIEKQVSSLPTEREVEDCNQKAKFLQSYGYLFKQGDFEMRLAPEYTGLDTEIIIELILKKILVVI